MSKPVQVVLLLLVLAGVGAAFNSPSGRLATSETPAAEPKPDDETPGARQASVLRETRGDCKGAEARAQHLSKRHPDWKPPAIGLVACHEFAVGITAEMLRASLGKPERVNTTHTVGHTDEQWIYGETYIYVNDGIVTSYQTSR